MHVVRFYNVCVSEWEQLRKGRPSCWVRLVWVNDTNCRLDDSQIGCHRTLEVVWYPPEWNMLHLVIVIHSSILVPNSSLRDDEGSRNIGLSTVWWDYATKVTSWITGHRNHIFQRYSFFVKEGGRRFECLVRFLCTEFRLPAFPPVLYTFVVCHYLIEKKSKLNNK
jgi:hypothetical protein